MGKKGKRLGKPGKHDGKQITATEPPNHDEMPPIFSLERLQGGQFCLSNLDQEHKASFADAIYRRRNITWREVKQTPKHGLGFEKIPRGQIKAAIPQFITEDHDYFLAFRYKGKAPMVGYRLRNIFYVLWFDPTFELYNH